MCLRDHSTAVRPWLQRLLSIWELVTHWVALKVRITSIDSDDCGANYAAVTCINFNGVWTLKRWCLWLPFNKNLLAFRMIPSDALLVLSLLRVLVRIDWGSSLILRCSFISLVHTAELMERVWTSANTFGAWSSIPHFFPDRFLRLIRNEWTEMNYSSLLRFTSAFLKQGRRQAKATWVELAGRLLHRYELSTASRWQRFFRQIDGVVFWGLTLQLEAWCCLTT